MAGQAITFKHFQMQGMFSSLHSKKMTVLTGIFRFSRRVMGVVASHAVKLLVGLCSCRPWSRRGANLLVACNAHVGFRRQPIPSEVMALGALHILHLFQHHFSIRVTVHTKVLLGIKLV